MTPERLRTFADNLRAMARKQSPLEELLEQAQAFHGALFQGAVQKVLLPLREAAKDGQKLRIVLSLREDSLGRFRDRARGWRTLLEGGFRLGPLTVSELLEVVLHLATLGQPSQSWSRDETRELVLQVRMPGQRATDEAEVQAAFAQIVCRALWAERAAGSRARAMDAENLLHRYLETTLAELGSLMPVAQRLLEEHLVARIGETEAEARAGYEKCERRRRP